MLGSAFPKCLTSSSTCLNFESNLQHDKGRQLVRLKIFVILKEPKLFFLWNQKILFSDSTIRACLASLRQQMNKLMQMMPGLSLFMGMSWPFFIRCLKYLDFLKKPVSILLVVQKKLFFLVIHNTWHARPCYPTLRDDYLDATKFMGMLRGFFVSDVWNILVF